MESRWAGQEWEGQEWVYLVYCYLTKCTLPVPAKPTHCATPVRAPSHMTTDSYRFFSLIQDHTSLSTDLLPELVRQFHCSHALYSHAHQLSPTHWELLSTVVSLKGLMLQMDPAAKQTLTRYISKVCVHTRMCGRHWD